VIEKIDHIGIAVRSLEKARVFYEQVLGLRCLGVEEVPGQQVRVAFFQVGGVRVELLEPTDTDGPVARFLEGGGEGVHHIAYAVKGIEACLRQASRAGCRLVHRSPVAGAGGKKIAFLHPKSTFGVLTEFCEKDGGG